MKIIIHRGTKEIGGSCVEVRTAQARVIIDIGMPLSLDGKPIEKNFLNKATEKDLKAHGILPDVQGLYKNETPTVDAIVLSHAHQDHYGLLRYIHPDIPVYLSDGARKILDISDIFLPFKTGKVNGRVIEPGKRFEIKDINVMPYLVDHSAFDALAFLLEGDKKRIFYSGDFRSHGRKGILMRKLIQNPPKKIDCLLMEGTCIGRDDKEDRNETAVELDIAKVLKTNEKITFFMSSSQNIDRLVTAFRACKQSGSLFIIDLYTAYVLDQLQTARKTMPHHTWEGVRVTALKHHEDKLIEASHGAFVEDCHKHSISMKEIQKRKNKMLFLTRDNRIFRQFVAKYPELHGATIIYSMWEGYLTDNFKAFCQKNSLNLQLIHVSGHARVKDLAAFARALNPKVVIPIHTFHAERYGEIFDNVKILKDGESWEVLG